MSWRKACVWRPERRPGLLGLGRKTEVARLHAHRQQRKRQRNEGIDVRDDTIGLLPENTGIVRREQIAQKPHHNGADAVDGGLFGQFFEHGRRFAVDKDIARRALRPTKIQILAGNPA